MSKSTVTYFLMLVISAAGLWIVLKSGSGLQAAPDLEDRWELFPPPGASDDTAAFSAWMDVEQSGRYLQIEFENGLKLDAKLVETVELPAAEGGKRLRLKLSAGEWTLLAEGAAGGDEFEFHLQGPRQYAFTGRRSAPTHTDEGRPEPR